MVTAYGTVPSQENNISRSKWKHKFWLKYSLKYLTSQFRLVVNYQLASTDQSNKGQQTIQQTITVMNQITVQMKKAAANKLRLHFKSLTKIVLVTEQSEEVMSDLCMLCLRVTPDWLVFYV